ncbi:hypothetical protein HY993_03670 [Candidatus Micrarchaeota archaeon]|nr:hypothetical protein [Candidatus Micrarchaeota archaeon]
MKSKAIAAAILLLAALALADSSTLTGGTSGSNTLVSITPSPTPTPAPTLTTSSGCSCTTDYAPVCGSNARTYSNYCFAKCDGITAFTSGECVMATPFATAAITATISPTPTPTPVQTTTASPTPSPAPTASATDAAATTVNPIYCSSCPADTKYVCGVDGATYLNPCFAECRQVYYTQGRCVGEPTPSPTPTPVTLSPTPIPSQTDAAAPTGNSAPSDAGEGSADESNAGGFEPSPAAQINSTQSPSATKIPPGRKAISPPSASTQTGAPAPAAPADSTTTQMRIFSQAGLSSQVTVTEGNSSRIVDVGSLEKISFVQKRDKTILELPKSISSILGANPSAASKAVEKVIEDNSSGIKIVEKRELSAQDNVTILISRQLDIPVKTDGRETAVMFVQTTQLIFENQAATGATQGANASSQESTVDKVELVTKEQTFDSKETALSGSFAQLRVELNTVPANAVMAVTTRQSSSAEERKAFEKLAAENKKKIAGTAFYLEVKTDLKQEVENATVIFRLNRKWVEENGGREKINLLRSSGGNTEVLSTKFVAQDNAGNYVFRAFSPNGLSVYAIVLLESVEETQKETSALTTAIKATPTAQIELQGGLFGLRGNDLMIFSIILVLAMAALILGLYAASLKPKA